MPGKVQYLSRKQKVKYNYTFDRLLYYTLILKKSGLTKLAVSSVYYQTDIYANVQLSLCLFKNHSIRSYGEMEVQLHLFLTSALDGGVLSVIRLCCFTPGKKLPLQVAQNTGLTAQPVGTSSSTERPLLLTRSRPA